MPLIKAVVFDLDGTIVSFNIDYKAVRAEVRSFLVKNGVPASVLSLNDGIFEMLRKVEIFMKNSGKSEKAFKEIRCSVLSIAEKHELEAAKNTKLHLGVKEVLVSLKNMNLKMGICTVNCEKSAQYVLKRFGIDHFFDAVVSRDNVKEVKPDVEHIKAVLRALNIAPHETIVVGDSPADMKCAREVKAVAVGLTTGISTPKELKEAGANYIITSITDLPTLIEQVNKA
ncbi:MAG: HAD family hydrolase [Candidatus Bathyarchaeia archaeon]